MCDGVRCCRCAPALVAIALLVLPLAVLSSHESPDGAALLAVACVRCHDGSDPRAPEAGALGRRSPQAIVDALTSGPMRYQGLALTGAERRAIAEFLTGRTMRGTVDRVTVGRCTRHYRTVPLIPAKTRSC